MLVLLAVVLALTGCVSRPPESKAIRALTPTEAVDLQNAALTPVSMTQRIASGERVGASGTLSILALSGGGSDGAYGVGVLNGWTKTGTRPEFDIVTGVSTGALMSVFAFLGPHYDAKLRQLYISQEDSDIFVKRGLGGVLGDSLLDNTPLKRQIEKHITSAVLAEVAQQHALGRRLYVATTNLDASKSVVWDMGLLASGAGPGRTNSLQMFQKVLRASAAIPVLFPPVYIKPKRGVQLRQAHVDGAVKAPVLLSDFIFKRPAERRELYVIINGSLAQENSFQAVAPNLMDIASMSVSGLLSELTHQVVYRGYVRARNSGTAFRITAIPDSVPVATDPLAFDQKRLRMLYALGEQRAQQPGFWWTAPPTLRKYDRVAAR
ncbi:MAG: patatin-like phospholipase family protein [Pseudomonadota bacterium]